jgi:hypothetical protein
MALSSPWVSSGSHTGHMLVLARAKSLDSDSTRTAFADLITRTGVHIQPQSEVHVIDLPFYCTQAMHRQSATPPKSPRHPAPFPLHGFCHLMMPAPVPLVSIRLHRSQ